MATTNKKKNVNYYLELPWTYTVETARDGKKIVYVVHVNELPGIATDASTLEEAMALIKEVMAGTFALYLKHGEEIPEPIDADKFKGNIAYRTSSQRHYKLFKEAQKKDQSLSQIIDQCIDVALKK